jgi:paraquat-inducible protein B
MPTIPSSMQQLAQTLESLSIQDMVNQAQQVLTSVHQLVTSDNIEEILAGANRLVNSKDLVELVGSANQAVTEMRTLMTDVGGGFEHISSSLDSTLVEVRQTLESLQDAMSAAEQTLSIASEGSPVRHGLEQTLTEISAAARSIRVLAEYLENHPDSLIRGKLGRN